MMKKLNVFFAVLLLATVTASSALAADVVYRLSIDGDQNEVQPDLSVGTHTLVVEVQVFDNELVPNTPGGLFQSAFDLSTDNGGFTFTDMEGGFQGGPDGAWDSTDFIPPFDTHNKGITDSGGGPTVIAETSAISPTNFVDKFALVGAAEWTVVAQGNFEYDGGDHPGHLDLTVALPFGGDIVVSAFEEPSSIIGALPDSVVNASIWFGDPPDPNMTPNTPPKVTDLFESDPFDQHTVASRVTPASYQMRGTDAEDGDDVLLGGDDSDFLFGGSGDDVLEGDDAEQVGNDLLVGDEGEDVLFGRDGDDANLDWTAGAFTGPFHLLGAPLPGSGNGNQTLNSTGLFEWDSTGSARGFYFQDVTVMDSIGLTDDGSLRVQVPEPSSLILAGLSLVGVFASRRRNS